MLPIALIDRVEAAIAGIAYTQPPPANATDQQALQQTKALSGRSGEYFAVGSVARQAVTIGEELIPADIPRMVIGNDDAPLVLRHPARLGADLAGRSNLLASLVSPEHVGAGIRWIRQDTEHPRMGLVSRVTPVHTAVRNCTRDEGGPFEVGNQVLISSHRELLSSKAMVVSVAETPGHDPVRQG